MDGSSPTQLDGSHTKYQVNQVRRRHSDDVVSLASTITIDDQKISFADGLSSTLEGRTKHRTGAHSHHGSGLSVATEVGRQLTSWALEGVQTLSANLSARAWSADVEYLNNVSPATGQIETGADAGHSQRRRRPRSWLSCLDEQGGETVEHVPTADSALGGSERLEGAIAELFHLEDTNGSGVLEECQLVKLNERMLCYGGYPE